MLLIDKGYVVITPSQAFNAKAAEEFSEEIANLIREGNNKIIVDLREVTLLSSAGLFALLTAKSRLQRVSGRLIVIDPSEYLVRIARIAGIEEELEIARVEEIMPEPISVLTYISTAVAVARFLTSEELATTIENIREYFARLGDRTPPDLDTPDALGLIELLVIDSELLDDLSRQIDRGVGAYRKCLSKASTVHERAACDRRAEKDVCDTLNRVMDRNDDELPSNYLRDQWTSFQCVRI